MGWMEDEAMEKTWDVFWRTGKVTDYLNYCTDKMDKGGTNRQEVLETNAWAPDQQSRQEER